MTDTTLASRIARWACALDGETLDAEVVAGLRLAVLDCLAAVLAGVPEEGSGLAAGHAPGPEGDGVATVIGHGKRTTMAGAAFANGTTAHACDYDDSSWVSWTHPTAAVLPAALAAAEARDLTGRCLLTALCVGLEVTKALGVGIQPEHYKLGWHPTGTLGVFGATAAVAKALGLGVERACAALGIAVSCSAGVGANVGTMTKPMHVGFAARNGVESALLAARGHDRQPTRLRGRGGLLRRLRAGPRPGGPPCRFAGQPLRGRGARPGAQDLSLLRRSSCVHRRHACAACRARAFAGLRQQGPLRHHGPLP